MTQLIGAVATAVWCGVATFVILKVVNVVLPLRASAEQENEGLDLVSARGARLQPLGVGASSRPRGSSMAISSPPSARFRAVTVPPCSSVTRAVIASPMPWPSCRWSRLLSVR